MSACSRCGAPFVCANADNTGQPCWCAELPPLIEVPEIPGASCWCPACLKAEMAQRQSALATTKIHNAD
jgi:hypothetical protein